MDNSSTSLWRVILGESLVLGSVPVVGTIIAFAYELGYASNCFGIPVECIRFDMTRIICSSLIVAFVYLPLLGFGMLAVNLGSSPRALSRVGALVIVVMVVGLVFSPSMIVLSLTALIGTIPIFVTPLAAENAAGRRVRTLDYVMISVLFVSICGGLWSLATQLGETVASSQVKQFVLAKEPTFVLVRRYGDEYVFKELDVSTGEVLDTVQILQVAEQAIQLKLVPCHKVMPVSKSK